MGRCDIGAYEAGLAATKQANGTLRPGGVVTYTINLNNLGGSIDLTTVFLTDTLPTQLAYIPNSLSATNGTVGESSGIITWTGTVFSNTQTIIAFGATISSSAVNQVITNTVVGSWAGTTTTSSASFDTISHIYLPVSARNFCADFSDDFSNPASGWPVGEDDLVRTEYLGGEYRILSKNGDYIYLFRSPTCDRANYVVEADARWVGTPGLSYGIIFGITPGFNQYYLFDVSADFRDFLLARRDPGGFTIIVPPTPASAINGGIASNHLKVTRNGSQITLEVNGTVLGTWFDGDITGSTGAGIFSNPYSDEPFSDARFDNFSMASLPGSGLAARAAVNATDESGGHDVVLARIDRRLRRGDVELEDR